MARALASPSNGQPLRQERSIGDLFGELAAETGTLVRQEVQLATHELAQKGRLAAQQCAAVVVGAALGLVSVMLMAAGAVLVVATILPLWAAALAVGALLGIVAATVALSGYRALARMSARPEQTLRSIQETKSWARELIQ